MWIRQWQETDKPVDLGGDAGLYLWEEKRRLAKIVWSHHPAITHRGWSVERW